MPNLPDITKRHVRLLTFTGLAVGVAVCPAAGAAIAAGEIVAVGAAVATGIAGIVAGITGSLVANELVDHDLSRTSVQVSHSQEKMANEDLIKASGLAVGWLIEATATSGRYAKEAKKLKDLALFAAQKWTMLISVSRGGKFPELDLLQEEEINTIFAHQGKDFFEQTVLSLEDWQVILQNGLCLPSGISLEDKTISDLATTLRTRFAKALREVLKTDFEEGGKAFAGLTLSMLGEMLNILRNGSPVGDSSAVLQGIKEIRELQQQLFKAQEADLAEIKSRQELIAQMNEAGFKVLGQKVDSGFEAVMAALGLQGEQIQDLQNWLRSELQQISQQLAGIKEDTRSIRTTVETTQEDTSFIRVTVESLEADIKNLQETLLGMKAEEKSRVQTLSLVLDTNPVAVTNWQGREQDLATVNGWLDDENSKLGIIVGIGGMGKSTLAAKVYHDRTDFVEKLWVDLGKGYKFPVVARKTIENFGKPSSEQLEQLEKLDEANLIHMLINILQKERFLLVWDNFETVLEDEGYGQFLQQWLGKCHNSEILLTTQEVPNLGQEKPDELALEGLKAAAGGQLLAALQVGGSQQELEEFSSRVSGHPLTLRAVAGLLTEEIGDGATLGELAGLGLLEMGQLLPRLQKTHRQEVYLVAVLGISFGRLAEKLQKVLLALVVVRGNFDAEMAAAISGASVTNQELRSLGKRGFSTIEESGKYTFQPFILEYLKYKAGDLTTAHQKAIEFYQNRFKPRDEWQTVADVQEYLEVFHHLCELGEYPAAFDVIRNDSNIDDVTNFLSLRGNNQILVKLYQQLKTHLTDKQDWRYSASLTFLGSTYYSLRRYDEAIKFNLESLNIAKELKDRQAESILLGNLGNAYCAIRFYQEAITHHQQSLDIKRERGDKKGETASLNNLGLVYKSLGHYDQAIIFFQQSLDIAKEIKNEQLEAASLSNLGGAYNSLGRYDEAIKLIKKSLDMSRDIGDKHSEANSLGNLGSAYNSLGRYDEAIKLIKKSLDMSRDIGDRQGEAILLGNLGGVYNSLGRYDEAIKLIKKSLDMSRDIRDRQGEATSLIGLGDAYYSLGSYQKAIDKYQKSLKIKQEIGDKYGKGACLYGLGNAYQGLEEHKTAINCYKQALKVLQPINHKEFIAKSLRGLSNTLIKLGNVANSHKNCSEAISYYEQAIRIKRELEEKQLVADLLFAICVLYINSGNISQGITANQEAHTIYKELGLPFDAYPSFIYPNWMKKIYKFAKSSKFKFILCIFIGIFASPFAIPLILIGFPLIIIYRLLRSRLPRR